MEIRRGMIAGVAAYIVWGGSPIFWKALIEIPAFEVLSWRVIFAVAMLVVLLTTTGRASGMRRLLANPRTLALALGSGAFLMVNWILFIWAVQAGHILECSLGYYINPLMSVALGVAVLGERLRPLLWISVAIAAVGVTAMTVASGRFPWIALSLATTFALYGLLKKNANAAPPLEGLFSETGAASIPIAGYLVYLLVTSQSVVVETPGSWGLLPFTGVITIVPLLLFGYAAQRIPLSSVGMLQYLAPTLQLIIGVWMYGEEITTASAFGFVTIWTALAIFAWDNLRTVPPAAATPHPSDA